MKQYLPAEVTKDIDFSTIEIHDVNTEIMINNKFDGSGEVEKSAADLAFKFEFKDHSRGFFLAHFEHQSTPDKKLAIRIFS